VLENSETYLLTKRFVNCTFSKGVCVMEVQMLFSCFVHCTDVASSCMHTGCTKSTARLFYMDVCFVFCNRLFSSTELRANSLLFGPYV
jgi:hypothetical protein